MRLGKFTYVGTTTLLLASALVGLPVSATAQTTPTNEGTAGVEAGMVVGAGLGGTFARFAVGDIARSSAGLSAHLLVGGGSSVRPSPVLQFDVSLFEPSSPVIDEAFRSVTSTLHVAIGGTWWFAPGLGVQLRRWSGPERVEDSDWGPVLTVTAGADRALVGGGAIVPSLAVTLAPIELEGSVGTLTVSMRLSWMAVR